MPGESLRAAVRQEGDGLLLLRPQRVLLVLCLQCNKRPWVVIESTMFGTVAS